MSLVDDVGGKKYSIILADPPWSYRDRALAGNRGSCCKYNCDRSIIVVIHTKGDPQTVSLGSPIVWIERKREEELMNSAEGETRD